MPSSMCPLLHVSNRMSISKAKISEGRSGGQWLQESCHTLFTHVNGQVRADVITKSTPGACGVASIAMTGCCNL